MSPYEDDWEFEPELLNRTGCFLLTIIFLVLVGAFSAYLIWRYYQ